MAHDVFISHSVKNKTTADAVCAALESAGIRCWIAPRDVVPGMEWGECIVEAIEGSKVMVLVFTADANASPQIRREVERAVNRGVAILPFRTENVLPAKALEYFLGSIHWLDALTPPLETHIKILASNIKIWLVRTNAPVGEVGATPLTAAPGFQGEERSYEQADRVEQSAAEQDRIQVAILRAEQAEERIRDLREREMQTLKKAEEERQARDAWKEAETSRREKEEREQKPPANTESPERKAAREKYAAELKEREEFRQRAEVRRAQAQEQELLRVEPEAQRQKEAAEPRARDEEERRAWEVELDRRRRMDETARPGGAGVQNSAKETVPKKEVPWSELSLGTKIFRVLLGIAIWYGIVMIAIGGWYLAKHVIDSMHSVR